MEWPVEKEQHPEKRARVASLDQMRGYAVFGMILVNYLGEFPCMPETLRHHNAGMSYADTIAPLFIFVAGMGFRMSFRRRAAAVGALPAALAALRRYAALILVGIVLYGPSLNNWQWWWDALVDIGFAGILALPFIGRGAAVRAAAAFGMLALYQGLYSLGGYGDWTMANSIDGGPLGVLPWTAIFLFGSLAQDLAEHPDRGRALLRFAVWGVALCAAGWLLRAEWPAVKAAWPFSQRGMSAPYPLTSAGLCFLTWIPFHFLCDRWNLRLPHLTVLGMNPLVVYIVQEALGSLHGTVVPQDSGPAVALAGFAGFYLACYAVARKLHRDNIVIKP